MQKKVSATKMFPLAQSSELGKIVAEEFNRDRQKREQQVFIN